MTVSQIKVYWKNKGRRLYSYTRSQLENKKLQSHTINFLSNCGFPDTCGPYMTFDYEYPTILPTVNELFRLNLSGLDDFLVIGSMNGDPICVNLRNEDTIVYLNHDNDFEAGYINTSVKQLAERIIVNEKFHSTLDTTFINNTIHRRNFSDSELNQVERELLEIDSECLNKNSPWRLDLDYIVWARDEEHK